MHGLLLIYIESGHPQCQCPVSATLLAGPCDWSGSRGPVTHVGVLEEAPDSGLVQPGHPCQLGSEPADVRPLISSTTLPFKYNKFSKKVPQTPLKKYGTITTSASILLGNADLQILNATENHLETLP